MKKWISKMFLLIVLCFSVAVSASAAQQGSLLLTKVEKPVMLVLVADEQGIPTESFAGTAEKLTQSDLTPAVAKTFYQHLQNKALSGETETPDHNKEVVFPDLQTGWYLVCSKGEKAEFAPFLIRVPMTLGNKTVYHIQAEPKVSDPADPTQPTDPVPPKPNIPQTGAILWPKYLLLALGVAAIGAGLVEVIRGREKRHE